MASKALLSKDQEAYYASQVEIARKNIAIVDLERKKIEDDEIKDRLNRKNLENLQFQRESVRAKLSDCFLKSPIDGKVIWLKKLSVGDIVDPADIAVRVADINKLEIKALLFESDIWRIESGANIYIRSGEEKIPAVLKRISRIGESSASGNKFPCFLNIDNASGRFRVGSSVEVVFQVDKRARVLAIPLKYLQQKGGVYSVLIQEPRRIVERAVEIGIDDTKYVEIRGGLKEGDILVFPSGREALNR